MSRPTSPYDSHPAMRERIALVEQLEGEQVEDSQEPMRDLLPNIQELQDEMTAVVQKNVQQRHGRVVRTA